MLKKLFLFLLLSWVIAKGIIFVLIPFPILYVIILVLLFVMFSGKEDEEIK